MTIAATINLDLAADVLVPTIAAFLAVVVALVTRHFQLRDKHRDELRALFSGALSAVADYQELPYLVRRRSDLSPMTPSELTWHASQIQSRLDCFIARLQLEEHDLGEAYELLVRATRQETGAHLSEAWTQTRIATDAEMPLRVRYPRDSANQQRNECLALMRSRINGRRILRRSRLRSAGTPL